MPFKPKGDGGDPRKGFLIQRGNGDGRTKKGEKKK